MNISVKGVILFMVMAMVASLSSCSSSLSTGKNFAQASASSTKPINSLNQENANSSSVGTEKSINVTVYTSDTKCQELIAQKVSVSEAQPIIGAVGKILEQQETADFGLSGYRIWIKNGVAIVDFRLSPHSQRRFTSLSICEQFALFGSLRKTLISNTQWKIKEVRFTERGKQIIF